MENIISYITKNKRPITRLLYLAAFLIEQLPDPDLPKEILGRTLTIADQLKSQPKRKRRNGKRPSHK